MKKVKKGRRGKVREKIFTWHLLVVAMFPGFPSTISGDKYIKSTCRGRYTRSAEGKWRYFLQDRMIRDCRRLSSRIGKRRANRSVSGSSTGEATKATRKEEEGALSGGSLAPIAPVDSRNIFARLTEPLDRRLLVRPIDVWARLLSDLLLAPAFVVFFRSGMRRPRLTLPGGEMEGWSFSYRSISIRFRGDIWETIKIINNIN